MKRDGQCFGDRLRPKLSEGWIFGRSVEPVSWLLFDLQPLRSTFVFSYMLTLPRVLEDYFPFEEPLCPLL